MRKVHIPENSTPPDEWIKKAEAATKELCAAKTDVDRKAIIEKYEGLWRDNKVRDWLLQLFHNKCWYTEAKESVSAVHVDHYRPKGCVSDFDKNQREGYWWLAFDWRNYRVCGQLINTKKNDVFPLCEDHCATANDPNSLKLEAPLLIDPITDDARLISYEMDEDSCRVVAITGIDQAEQNRVDGTIEILGLNRLDRLNQNRADVWRKCADKIKDYSSASDEPQSLKQIRQATVIVDLKKMIDYKEEFSSVAEACIRKTAPEAVKAKVYEAWT
ncbi:hypothetical protein [Azonexus sp.]|jgi:uncharacterized protein (TIGR02646 family)|uniref:hypothetical protein n=1 Tax=Azonexus sp. TaxID=1872668 RepID=UPI00282854F2|nr:hypothetical protein [Azonexus sp.]MDR1994786.1 hypothetical protein [Azonexus sp.]